MLTEVTEGAGPVQISRNFILNDAEFLITNMRSVIEADIEQGVLPRDDVVYQRYDRAVRIAFQTLAAVSASFDDFFLAMNNPGSGRTENQFETQAPVDDSGNFVGEFESLQTVARQLDDGESTYSLQQPNEYRSQFPHIPNTTIVSEPIVNLPLQYTTQHYLDVSSSTHCQSQSILFDQQLIEDLVVSTADNSHGFSESLRDSEFSRWLSRRSVAGQLNAIRSQQL